MGNVASIIEYWLVVDPFGHFTIPHINLSSRINHFVPPFLTFDDPVRERWRVGELERDRVRDRERER